MEAQTSLAEVLIFSCAVIGLLSSVIIIVFLRSDRKITKERNNKVVELYKNTIETEKKTRENIYSDMHDQINPTLRALLRNIRMRQQEIKSGKTVAAHELDFDLELIVTTIEDIKRATKGTVPTFLKDFGLVLALEDKFRILGSAADIDTRFVNKVDMPDQIFEDENRRLNAFLLASAIMDNIFRHSGCAKCELHVAISNGAFIMTFIHDGQGIANEKIAELRRMPGKVGLKSSAVRALMLNATVDYRAGSEASAEITIPL